MKLKIRSDGTYAGTKVLTDSGEVIENVAQVTLSGSYTNPDISQATLVIDLEHEEEKES